MARGRDDRFFTVPTEAHTTSEGPVELPIRYYDVSVVVAVFSADRRGAEELLAGTGVELAGGRAVVALAFYEYRDTSVGAYNEVGTAIFAQPAGARWPRLGWLDAWRAPPQRTIGAWVVDLPVTTPIANAAGRELWGYPKFVTEIDVALRGRLVEARVADPSGAGDIVTLRGRLGPSVPAPPMSVVTFTQHRGQLWRTHVDVRGVMRAHAPGSVRLEVGRSKHRMAENLERLGLASARPLAVLATDAFQSKLWAGAPARVLNSRR